MNRERDLVELLNSFLGLAIGESRALRDPRHFDCTVHRYDDGWYALIDRIADRVSCSRVCLGWRLDTVEDMVDFLTCDIGPRLSRFAIVGER